MFIAGPKNVKALRGKKKKTHTSTCVQEQLRLGGKTERKRMLTLGTFTT